MTDKPSIRNVAIIAHVDHGKTTLVDGLLKQSHTFRDNEAEMKQTLILDSNDQERERGITILAKNTAVTYKDTKINIIDTPGHADFGGEVERTLHMADGVLLIIDAQEGPMPQTKFVLKKALELNLKPIVVINKIDKRDARVDFVINATADLFLDLAHHDDHLEYPVYYAIGRDSKAWEHMPADFNEPADLSPIFDAIIKHIPAPTDSVDGKLQFLVTTLDRDDYQGKYLIGRIKRGSAKSGQAVVIIDKNNNKIPGRIDKVFVSQGLKRQEVPEAFAGDVVALTGIPAANIGDTVADPAEPTALPTIAIEEPTLQIAISVNTSPFAGKEGDYVTNRQLLERINKELETNVALRMEQVGSEFILAGRGELHLAVFIEQLRREGYEMQVGKPRVITKEIDGVVMEPVEDLTIDVASERVGAVAGEVGRRKGVLLAQQDNADKTTRLTFEITTRGMLGLRGQLLTISRGTAVMNSSFLRYEKLGAGIPKLRNGVLISSNTGKAVAFGLNIAQGRGITFIAPQAQVYEGMIVGLNSREEDIEINVTKEKKLSNMRASGSDENIILAPPTSMTLEQSLSFLEDDELLEVTPQSLRLRKKALTANDRSKTKRG